MASAAWLYGRTRRNPLLQSLLAQRGYPKQESGAETAPRRSMGQPVARHAPAEGYTIRSLGEAAQLPARSWASWRGFHPDEPDEKSQGWEWYPNVQRTPLYKRDLDLVAATPGGEIAAFCTVWFDDVTRTAAFELVATVPEHYRRGLASAVMAEGLRQVQHLGAKLATVGSYSPRAHALYESMGFTDTMLSEPWAKEFSPD